LIVCLPLLIIYLSFFYFNKRWIKIMAAIFILALMAALIFIFVFKDQPLIKNSPLLDRLTSISLTSGTANNRLMTWSMALAGFKEKPILGWGQENFYQVFDKYYSTKNSEQWFDRSHNVIFDRLITGGILGLLSYLALLFLPFYFLWRYYQKRPKETAVAKETAATGENPGRKYFTPLIFSLLIISYFIQNLFIFEALVIYIPLFTLLGFASQYGPEFNWRFLSNGIFKKIIAVVAVVLLLPAVYFFNIKPVSANRAIVDALSDSSASLADRIDAFEAAIGRQTLGNQEYRRQYFSFYQQVLRQAFSAGNIQQVVNDPLLKSFTLKMEQQLQDQIEENPHSVINYIILMDFYNSAYYFNPQYLLEEIFAFQQAIPLSPNRPQVYYSGALSYYYLASFYQFNNQPDLATENYQLCLDNFYRGAKLNYQRSVAFDDLMSFLLQAFKNKDLALSAVKNGVADKTIAQFLTEISAWSPLADGQAQIKEVIKLLKTAAPADAQLKDF